VAEMERKNVYFLAGVIRRAEHNLSDRRAMFVFHIHPVSSKPPSASRPQHRSKYTF
jgi:hypothetical protein